METLVVVAHHRNHNQYYGKKGVNGSTKLDIFGSLSAGKFSGINCRSYQSGAGLLPTPFKSFSTPGTKKSTSRSLSPKTASSSVNEKHKSSKRNVKSSPIPIPININLENEEGGFPFSERWAGPAYSSSPPPSSLPLPNFFMRPKRTVSLDLPTSAPEIDLPTFSISAPASPTRERSPSPSDLFDCAHSTTKGSDLFDSTYSATKTLRRILNLDVPDE